MLSSEIPLPASATNRRLRPLVPRRTVLASWVALLLADAIVKLLGFWRLYRVVNSIPTMRRINGDRAATASAICESVETASLKYFRHVRCLQSAAAAVSVLRLHGIPARLVIGVRRLPFEAHAWVMVDEQVVLNDRPDLASHYKIIDGFDVPRAVDRT